MGWSIRIARIAGTDVKVHVTFLLLLAWVWFTYYRVGGPEAAWQGVLFIILLFARGFAAAGTHDRRRRAIVFGALAGCFAIAVHSFVEFNLQVTSNAQMFLALAALATAGRRKHGAHDGDAARSLPAAATVELIADSAPSDSVAIAPGAQTSRR